MRFRRSAKGEIELLDANGKPLDMAFILARKRGYGVSVDIEAEFGSPEQSSAADRLYPQSASEAVEQARQNAMDVLKEARIFDWEKWFQKRSELSPDAAAAIDVMGHALYLEYVGIPVGHERLDAVVTAAIRLGMALEELRAQRAWMGRNPPLSANARKKAKVEERREMLADFIRDKGERPATQPGAWYEKFRKAYKKHSASDRTLKADYPHALALSRKRTPKP